MMRKKQRDYIRDTLTREKAIELINDFYQKYGKDKAPDEFRNYVYEMCPDRYCLFNGEPPRTWTVTLQKFTNDLRKLKTFLKPENDAKT